MTIDERTDRLITQVSDAVDAATECGQKAHNLVGETNVHLRNDYRQRAHQCMYNAILSSNLMVANEVMGLRKLLEAQYADVDTPTAEGDPA